MDISQLLDVSGFAHNPARADLLGTGRDAQLCITLGAWVAEGRAPANLHGNGNNTFFLLPTALQLRLSASDFIHRWLQSCTILLLGQRAL